MDANNAVASSSTASSAVLSKSRNRMPGVKIVHPPSTAMRQQQEYKPEKYDEHWVVFYHEFLLHTCKHSECFWHRSLWWFPEPGRNADTMPMFVAARWASIDGNSNIKYYNLHLPNGKIIENVMYRFTGRNEPSESWLHDYVGYNLNLVTIDMRVLQADGTYM